MAPSQSHIEATASQPEGRDAAIATSETDKVVWTRDVWLLLAARFVRMLAFGSSSLVLALFLSGLGLSPVQVGRFLTLTLIGDFILSLLLTFIADSVLGRRNTLRFGACSMLFSGLVFASTNNQSMLLVAAVFGVISPSGNEIGPFRAVEESILAELVDKQHRPSLFGWYVVTGSLAASLATWLGGSLNRIVDGGSRDSSGALMTYYRWIFIIYSVLGFLKLRLSFSLSSRCEPPTHHNHPAPSSTTQPSERDLLLPPPPPTADTAIPVPTPTPEQQDAFPIGKLLTLCSLFALDSLGSGMVSQTLVSWFLSLKFNAPLSSLGTILSFALLVSSLSNLFSARLENQLGLVPTMVLTHLPSNIVLALTPLPSGLALTSALIVARAATSSMDQAPRSVFLSAFVPATHRTRVLGLVNTIKTLAQSAGPSLTGSLTAHGHMSWAFHLAGLVKSLYDLGLMLAFSTVT